MRLKFVEKQTSVFTIFFALPLVLFGSSALAATCDSLFVSTTRASTMPTLNLDYHVIEAILNEPRTLRMNEISADGLRLFLANMEIFATQKGFEPHHDLIDLRVYKFRHGDVGRPFSGYQVEISFSQNGVAYDVDLQFYSNGSVAYLASPHENTKAVATATRGPHFTFLASDIDSFISNRPRDLGRKY